MSQTATETVRRRIREIRERRGFSARQLAERCSQAGFPSLDRDVIANLESGRRRSVSIEEVLALAFALDVAPVHLFVPVENYAELRLGTTAVAAEAARSWVRGEHPLPDTDLRAFETEVPDSEYASRERMVRELSERLQATTERLHATIASTPPPSVPRESRHEAIPGLEDPWADESDDSETETRQ